MSNVFAERVGRVEADIQREIGTIWQRHAEEAWADLDKAQQRIAELEGQIAAAAGGERSSRLRFHITNAVVDIHQRNASAGHPPPLSKEVVDAILARLQKEGEIV